MLRISGFYDNNCTNGDGWRSVIFFSGCPHQCPDCQNPDTWDCESGYDMSVQSLFEHVHYNAPLIDGVTLSGGEPFQEQNVPEIIELIEKIKTEGLNIWCYTGYTFEALLKNPQFKSMLISIDVLVDGPFVKSKFDPELKFRGSSNQRIIDVQESLKQDEIVLHSH